MLDVEATLCYLGDMLCSGGGCDIAIAARCCVAWGKFRKLLPALTTRHLSPRIRDKVYEACVRSAMLHDSETWGPKELELRQLCGNDRAMIRWIRGIKDKRRNTLSFTTTETWYRGHYTGPLLLVTQMVWPYTTGRVLYQITNFPLPGTSKKRRPRKKRPECMKTDVEKCSPTSVDPEDRDAWRAGVIAWCCQPLWMGHGQHLNLKWIWWMDGGDGRAIFGLENCKI